MTPTNLSHEHPGTDAETHKSPYIKVFLWLAVFTAIEYFYARWQKDAFAPLVLGLMVCAVIKASMVGWYFMHLKFEQRWVYYMLVPAGILACVFIFALTPDIALQPDIRRRAVRGRAGRRGLRPARAGESLSRIDSCPQMTQMRGSKIKSSSDLTGHPRHLRMNPSCRRAAVITSYRLGSAIVLARSSRPGILPGGRRAAARPVAGGSRPRRRGVPARPVPATERSGRA